MRQNRTTKKRDSLPDFFFLLVTENIGGYGDHPPFLRRILEQDNVIDYPTPAVVHAANLRLLASILKVAVNDWWQLDETGENFCDRSHTKICKTELFRNGKEELEEFFESEWIEFICDELSLEVKAVRAKVELEEH